MPRNGSGTYVPPSSSWNPAAPATTIDPVAWNSLLSDMVTALSGSLAADGQTTASARVPFAQGIQINAGAVGAPAIRVAGSTTTGLYSPAANQFAVAINGIQALLMSTGANAFTGGLSATGLLDISAVGAGQISFPVSQNPSAGANVLDDYEEGSWVPAISFGGASVGATYTAQTGGEYVKIGKRVFVGGQVGLTSKGSSVGGVIFTGLPFAPSTANNSAAFRVSNFSTTALQGLVFSGGVQMEFAGGSVVQDTNVANNSVFVFSASYSV